MAALKLYEYAGEESTPTWHLSHNASPLDVHCPVVRKVNLVRRVRTIRGAVRVRSLARTIHHQLYRFILYAKPGRTLKGTHAWAIKSEITLPKKLTVLTSVRPTAFAQTNKPYRALQSHYDSQTPGHQHRHGVHPLSRSI